jgi:hypothetical protein
MARGPRAAYVPEARPYGPDTLRPGLLVQEQLSTCWKALTAHGLRLKMATRPYREAT